MPRGTAFTLHELHEITRMRTAGASYQEIAKALGRSTGGIFKQIQKMNGRAPSASPAHCVVDTPDRLPVYLPRVMRPAVCAAHPDRRRTGTYALGVVLPREEGARTRGVVWLTDGVVETEDFLLANKARFVETPYGTTLRLQVTGLNYRPLARYLSEHAMDSSAIPPEETLRALDDNLVAQVIDPAAQAQRVLRADEYEELSLNPEPKQAQNEQTQNEIELAELF